MHELILYAVTSDINKVVLRGVFKVLFGAYFIKLIDHLWYCIITLFVDLICVKI